MRAAALLMIIQVLSRILGLVRDIVMVNIFGRDYATDAFNAAFSIPDFIYNILIGGAITAAFIPVFSACLTKGNTQEAWRISSIFTSWIVLLMLVGLTISYIFTEPLMDLLTQYSPEELKLPVLLARITLIQALFMALSAIATGILQSNQHFTWPAIGILLYNLFIIIGGVALAGPIEAMWPGYGIAGFSIGVVVGSLTTILVQIPTLKKVGFKFRPSFDTKNAGFRQIVVLIIPVVIGLSVAQINMFVTQYLATGLEEGILTALRTAQRFMQLPIGIFAASIAVAIFPTMTSQAASNNMVEMKRSYSLGLRTILFISIPSAVGMMVLREPILRLIFELTGEFTAEDTFITGQALLYYCIGLAAYAAITVGLRGFYAIKNTLTPLLISITTIVINIIFSYALVGPMGHRGLALAFSLAGIANCVLLVYFLRRKIGPLGLKSLGKTLIQTGIACLAMGLAVWGVAMLSESLFGIASKISQIIQVALSIGVGTIVFFVVTSLMKMEEFVMVRDMMKKRRERRKIQAEENEDKPM